MSQFAHISDQYLPKEKNSKFTTPVNPETFQHLITLEVKMFRKETSGAVLCNTSTSNIASSEDSFPYTDITANFSNLDVVFNAKSWITLLNFLYKLKTPTSRAASLVNDNLQESIVSNDPQNDRKVISKPSFMHIGIDPKELDNKSKRTLVNINFKKLNILLMRHIVKNGASIGRKLATVTMQGAHAEASFVPQTDLPDCQNSDLKVNVTGSIGGLQLQDLTSTNSSVTKHGYEVLSIGSQDTTNTCGANTQQFSEDQIKAFSFQLQHNVIKSSKKKSDLDQGVAASSASTPIISASKLKEHLFAEAIVSDTMLFKMDPEDSTFYKPNQG